MDSRREQILSTFTSFIPSEHKDACLKKLQQDDGTISAFLDEANCPVLAAGVKGLESGKLSVKLLTRPAPPQEYDYQVVLSKLRPGALSAQDLPANIAVSTMAKNAVSSLYHTIKDVYSPALGVGRHDSSSSRSKSSSGAANAAGLSHQLADLIVQVEAGLGAAARRGKAGSSGDLDPRDPAASHVFTPLDELDFWASLASGAAGATMAKVASQVSVYLEGMRSSFEGLQDAIDSRNKTSKKKDSDVPLLEGGWEAAKEAVDAAIHALRQVWPIQTSGREFAMPQQRVEHLFKVIGQALSAYIQMEIKSSTLWTSSVSQVRPALLGASRALARLQSESYGLTQDWLMKLDTGGHEWQGQPWTDPAVQVLQERLEEVLMILESCEEINRLLGPDEAQSSGCGQALEAFNKCHALQVSESGQAAWSAAKAEFEQRMAPIEQRVSQKLKQHFSMAVAPSLQSLLGIGSSNTSNAAASQQVVQELQRYATLMSRPSIDALMAAEKEALAKQIDSHLDSLQHELDDQRKLMSSKQARSGMAERIMWSAGCLQRLSKVREVVSLMLGPGSSGIHSDLGSSTKRGGSSSPLRSCLATCVDMMKEVEELKKEAGEEWQIAAADELGNLAAWKDKKLLRFDTRDQHIKAEFSEGLVSLLREVRQLQALGLAIKKDVLAEVETASRFYRYGMELKQRTNFYNNISTEMIPCQKPMLLAYAKDFEKVLMEPKDAQGKEITWRSAAALRGYVERLKNVAENLADRNRQLRRWHEVVCGKVVGLMSTDLVRHRDRWVAGVKDMREVFAKLESQGYNRGSQEVWRQHWDFQLYKSLNFQYNQGLRCINTTLPQQEVRMVFKQQRLQYDPPLEELRLRHYKDNLNTFLGLPLSMKGVSELSERAGFFKSIADTNPAGMAQVYMAAEGLFNQLSEEIKKYQDWLVLGSVNLEEVLDSSLVEVQDWELNFKVLKAAARDAEKLPNQVQIDCYSVSLLPIKAAVDDQLKRFQEALVASLRRKAIVEKEQMEEFVNSGKELLGRTASTVEDIGNAAKEARALVDSLGDMMQVKRRIEEKNKLLRAMAAGSGREAQFATVDMTEMNAAWEGFISHLQQFDASLEEQKQQLAVAVTKQLEEFRSKIVGFASRWAELKPKKGPSGNPAVVLNMIETCVADVKELREESAQLMKEAAAFKIDMDDVALLDETEADVLATKTSWDRYAEFLKERNEMANRDWLSMRDQVWKIEDFLAKWTKATEGKNADDAIAVILLGEIEAYKRCLPYLKTSMRAAGWEDTHWYQLFQLLGLKTSGPNAVSKETVTLAHFLDAAEAVVRNADAIKSLDAQAQGEALIRKALTELKMWGLQRELDFTDSAANSQQGTQTTSRSKVPLIKEWRDVLAEIGDHQSLVASLKQSAYHHLFKDEVATWDAKLALLQEGLGLLNQIQRRWVYLEPIFGRGALPAQQARFRNVDDEFRRVMGQIGQTRLVVSFADIPGIREKLPHMAQQLDVCQRALSDFLEDKRASFPRFYFLGDDDLLEILGQSRNPAVIQAHLRKLFAGIHRVSFSPDKSAITAMMSMEGELVDMQGVRVTEAIETWLADLAKSMRSTLATQLIGIQSGQVQDTFRAAASQILCLHDATTWTESVEAALRNGQGNKGLSAVKNKVSGDLQRLAAADYTGNALLQAKKQALILDYIHYLDVMDQLVRENATALSDWVWQRQLRYYTGQQSAGGVRVCMAEASFEYTWEYQGNAPKLVYTPLTDKCYLTLTQGMALGYGGNPYGPAGTGKTESVKALGQALGRQVLVFNCDEEFDFKSMGRIFVGLVKCGAWGCFDEFNRLDEEVLSAVSQQIQTIQAALKEGASTMQFMEKTVEVDRNAGIFVTLNPAGKGYGGRSKLPDNLKQLFRSIAMTVPDNDLIAEVLLVSEGFNAAKDLARKMVSLFSLSRELLSPQQHYDWGLRALKTSLGIAGRELRDVRKSKPGEQLSPAQEAEIVVRAVCATKLPTLTFADNKRFRALLGDLFPGVNITDAQNAELEAAIHKAAASMQLELTKPQVEKMLQLHLACEQRIGVIIVGPSGTGKTTLWAVLEKAYELLGCRPKVYRMNPKAMARQQLLGHMNLDTREWTDGVLTAAARKVVRETLEQRSWIVCDGDVDPEWIESLNSVLDDNRLLTMPNGERIQFASNVNFIFECHSLEFASPATVSRCGMLFLSDEALDVERLITRWIKQRSSSFDTGQLAGWINDYLYKAFDWSLNHSNAVETTKVGLLDSVLSQLSGGCGSKRDFAQALARGLGANMSEETRSDFLNDLARMTGESGGLLDSATYGGDPLACLGMDLRDPSYDAAGPSFVITQQVSRDLGMIATWIKEQEPFILVGPDGCGKSTLLDYCFSRVSGLVVATVNCSAQTNAANIIQKLVQVCGKPVTTTTGKALRPPDNTRAVLYLKDLNLPKPDKYNTSQVVSFLQQLLTHGGYYDNNLEFIHVERVQIVGSMSPPSTVGRHPLSTRFTARVRVLSMSLPDSESLQTVYTDMIGKLLPNTGGISAAKLSQAMLDLYSQVRETFTVNDQPHYQFNPRDVSRWVQGLTRYSLDHGFALGETFMWEAARIFRDRLTQEDGEAFTNLLATVASTHLGARPAVDSWVASSLGATAEDRLSGDPARTRLDKWAMDDFKELVASKLKNYEREHKDLHMLLFPEVLDRLARLDRALSRPGGSALLAGPSGCGRRSCVLLMAYMLHMEVFTPKMSRQYELKTFRNDLKEVMKKAGGEGKPVMLLLEDYQILSDSFLELLNALLCGGEVPGLFSLEELVKEQPHLEQEMTRDDTYTGSANIYDYFVYRVSRNLRVVISMDPSNELFKGRCEANPALLTNCSVQWWGPWTKPGAQHVAATRLRSAMQEDDTSGDTAKKSSKDKKKPKMSHDEKQLVSHLVWLHESMLSYGASPRHYLSLVDLYAQVYKAKRKEVLDQQGFLQGGLSKLSEAEATVDGLSKEADKQREVLKAKQAEADRALQRIQASMMQAADRRQAVERLQEQQHKEEVELQGRRGGVEVELAEVQPMIDQARKAVGQIKKENIDEIRSLKMPPDAIRDVLEGVLLVLGQQDTSWNNMKKFLGAKAVKDEIVNYDARKITPEMRSKVGKLLAAKGNSFEQQVIYRVSVAAAPLAAWVTANMAYSKVLEKVAPLESELAGLYSSLENSKKLIQQYQAELSECDSKVATLRDEFAALTAEAGSLKLKVDQAEGTVSAARSLLDKLGGERSRWVQQVKSLDEDLAAAPLAALMTAAFIVYLPAHPEDIRAQVLSKWQAELGLQDSDYDLCRFLSSESEMLSWKAQGLPADSLSRQNAVIILNSQPTVPLIIDPAMQAAEWLVTHLRGGSSSLEVTSMHDSRFVNTLELALRFGKTLVVHDADHIEPCLFPLLRRDMERQGPRHVIPVGDKLVDYNETFRLFLVTRNPEPFLPPDARSLVAVTNFTVTRSGLEGQLLGLVLQKELPELEEKKSKLLQQEEDFKIQLAAAERSLLQTLASTKGNLLENKELLDSLNAAKASSSTISASLAESRQLQSSLDAQREVYRPIAARGTALFFMLRELHALNHMYQFSLGMFLALFGRAMEADAAIGNDVAARISRLSETLQELVFMFVSRSLFNADRLTFGMHVAYHSSPQGAVKPEEWAFLLGRPLVDAPAGSGNAGNKPTWVRDESASSWSLFTANFPSLVSQAELADGNVWGPWAAGNDEGGDGDSNSKRPNSSNRTAGGNADIATPPIPSRVAGKVTPFQALLIVKCFRPEKLQSAMTQWVCNVLRVRGVSPPTMSLRQVVEQDSSASQPVLLITTPGADPTAELAEYAEHTVGRDKFHEIAMGQGQQEKALTLLRESARSGEWLVLKNLHLAVSWLPILEKEVHNLSKSADFRLFLTSEPHSKFPATLLEASVKVTYEAPPGLKKNLLRAYEGWSTDFVAGGSPLRAQLLFVLAWFHAVMQERRAFIPQGWSKFYEFSYADLRSGADVISLATKPSSSQGDHASVRWGMLHGLLGTAIYGGRLDNTYDSQVLRTYISQFFHAALVGLAGGKVTALPGSRIGVPTTSHKQDYVQLIQQLSDVDVPQLFSLPANISRSAAQGQSERVIASLRTITASQASSSGFNKAQWSAALGPLLRLWDTLMAAAPGLKQAAKEVRGAGRSSRTGGNASSDQDDHSKPVDSFVALERAAAVALVDCVNKTLSAISKVLRGHDTLSSTVQVAGQMLLADIVPGEWDTLWEGPSSPSDYIRAVASRAVAIEQWWSKSQGGKLLSAGPLDLSHLFHPSAFLGALRQQTARQAKIPMDHLRLVTCWDGSKLGSGAIQVGGLLIQGAVFDGTRLSHVVADAPTSRAVPPMGLAWVPKDSALPYSTHLAVPLYTDQTRQKVLAEIQMPLPSGSDEEEGAAYILAGLAVFLAS